MMRKPVHLKGKILTIPNLLSLLRLIMIPIFVWLYGKGRYGETALVLILSGVTDMCDGFIARRFHMVSDLGKILDPVADKLTQGIMLICLCTRFRLMLIPLILMIVKELIAAVTGAMVISRTNEVHGAEWHGKITTWALYIMMILHVLWYNIPAAASDVLIILCVILMTYSMICYSAKNLRLIRAVGKQKNKEDKE